jgi:hypothetical protein
MLYKNPFESFIDLWSIIHIIVFYKWMQNECIQIGLFPFISIYIF